MRIVLLACCLALASAAAAETIYKYRGPDGRPIYSNRIIPGANLIESYEHEAIAPPPHRDPSKSDAEAEARITKRLAALDQAWNEVQESGRALAAAEARLAAGIGPDGSEVLARGGPEVPVETTPEPPPPAPKPPPIPVVSKPLPHSPGKPGVATPAPAEPTPPASDAGSPAPPEVGGPMTPSDPAVGGPANAASPAVGGPMSQRRGGGMRSDYRARMAALEAAVKAARARNEAAWRRYNELR